MRISKEPYGWHADGVRRRDFRHTHGEPEVDTSKVRRKKQRPPKARITCKHVWVEVDYAEYIRYADRTRLWWRYYIDLHERSAYPSFMRYFVCAGCLETKTKEDKAARRVYYRRKWRKRR